MDRYQDKTVVITGGASGIGRETARLLLDEGARVLITGRSDEALDKARVELGGDVLTARSDASSLVDIDALATRVRDEFGALDALIVCAGQTRFVPFEQMTEEVYDEVLAVNAKGPYFTVLRFAPLMREGSAVSMITSVADAKGIPLISAYAASKAALRSMTRSLASELLPRGIRVNAVSPGPIDSGILEKSLPADAAAQARQQMTDDTPMKRFGRPDEVGRALIFLAFEATYTTGAELVVDGGGTQL